MLSGSRIVPLRRLTDLAVSSSALSQDVSGKVLYFNQRLFQAVRTVDKVIAVASFDAECPSVFRICFSGPDTHDIVIPDLSEILQPQPQ